MNRRKALNSIAWFCGLAFFCAVALASSGCATYNIKRCENGVCSSADIKSTRKFKSIALRYNGTERTFELEAGDVGTDTGAITALSDAILKQAETIQTQQGQQNE